MEVNTRLFQSKQKIDFSTYKSPLLHTTFLVLKDKRKERLPELLLCLTIIEKNIFPQRY